MNELIFFLNKVLISGAVIGSIYAMGAIGITLIFSILRFAHFAHGDLMTTGAFITFVVYLWSPYLRCLDILVMMLHGLSLVLHCLHLLVQLMAGGLQNDHDCCHHYGCNHYKQAAFIHVCL